MLDQEIQDEIKNTLQTHKTLHKEKGKIPPRDDTYYSIDLDDKNFFELTHSKNESIFHIKDHTSEEVLKRDISDLLNNSEFSHYSYNYYKPENLHTITISYQ